MCLDRRRSGVATMLLQVTAVHRVALLLIASGCVIREPSELSPYVEPPPLVPDVVVAPGGPHRVATHFELEVDDLVTERAMLTQTVAAFASTPGATMLALTEGSAPLAVLRADLPSALEQRLAGWIDEAVGPLSRIPALTIQWTLGASFDTFDVESELVFDAGTVRHRLVAVAFTPGGLDHRFELTDSTDNVLEATAATTTAGYSLTFDEHELAFGTGEMTWDAVDANLSERGGIRGTLGAGTQCSIVAALVATKCDGGACVGHLDELTQLCEQTLDEVVVRGRAEAAAFRFTTLRIHGQVGMNDTNGDGVSESLFGGEWDAWLLTDAGAITTTIDFD